jgi:hypothetical protein
VGYSEGEPLDGLAREVVEDFARLSGTGQLPDWEGARDDLHPKMNIDTIDILKLTAFWIVTS